MKCVFVNLKCEIILFNHDKSQHMNNFVMLIEIPEPEVILGVIISFVIGLVGLYGYYKIRPFIKTKNEMIDSSQLERLEYYEKQLIDMKIRLDAILFSSLMNSENPYFITQAQALGAPSVLKFGLEPLPTAYLIIGDGTSAWFVGSARGIPFEKPKIAAAYALAAQFLGMRFVYLEAGSGAKSSVTPEMVKTVRKAFNGFLIVGGGIRDIKTATDLVKVGADALVIGTFLEKGGSIKKLAEIAKAIQRSK